ncbi:MAG: endonuclease III [Saccharofermentans sp.]|nr:endonuclease III [Saccharofermentans sp.]
MIRGKKQLASKTLELLRSSFPNSSCTLDTDSSERLAIRGILSAQCTDIRVNATCIDLFSKYESMDELAAASEEEIAAVIKPCGLTKAKSHSIKVFSTKYCNEWNYSVPQDVDELMTCPGIGKKIANLIIGEIYGIPAIVVDTHMKRVMYRIGLTDNENPLLVEKDLCKVFPEECWIKLGHMAVDLGRTYCMARGPKCEVCPLSEVCKRRIDK